MTVSHEEIPPCPSDLLWHDDSDDSQIDDDDQFLPSLEVEANAIECVGTCMYKTRDEIRRYQETPLEICQDFRQYCESHAMSEFCHHHGVLGASFTWNHHLKVPAVASGSGSKAGSGGKHTIGKGISKHSKGKQRNRMLFSSMPLLSLLQKQSPLYTQFWQAFDANPDLHLCLGFHGTTSPKCVSKILKQGMDPQYRRTQAFGHGDYFAKEPGLSATYGSYILVFLLLVPKDAEKRFHQKDRDIMVLPDSSHQLPIGVLQIDGTSERAIQHSQKMRLEHRSLKVQAMDHDWLIQQEELCQQVQELLTLQNWEQASDVLRQATKYHKLVPVVEDELVYRIHASVTDAAIREQYFARFASLTPMSQEKFESYQKSKRTLSQLQAKADQAWHDFWDMKVDPARNLVNKAVASKLFHQRLHTCHGDTTRTTPLVWDSLRSLPPHDCSDDGGTASVVKHTKDPLQSIEIVIPGQ